jgi:hypothetical protein
MKIENSEKRSKKIARQADVKKKQSKRNEMKTMEY